jgi:predicted NAD-dependent protein-ADP-ribosyltransferase YbiA (DUF1768 family)
MLTVITPFSCLASKQAVEHVGQFSMQISSGSGSVLCAYQHPGLRSILLATAPTELVEASPYDLIWGIGLGERDPRLTDRSQWRGQNLLGITLMRVRDALAMN